MRTPRIRLRVFFLLATLASLITAAFAIRARTGDQLSAQQHASLADRERITADDLGRQIQEAGRKLERIPRITRDQVSAYDLRLMPPGTTWAQLPTAGEAVVVMGHTHGSISFRVFDDDGNVLVDWSEGGVERIGTLETQLASLDPPHELTAGEKDWVLTLITSFVEGHRTASKAGIARLQARHAEAVARAEDHERIARRP